MSLSLSLLDGEENSNSDEGQKERQESQGEARQGAHVAKDTEVISKVIAKSTAYIIHLQQYMYVYMNGEKINVEMYLFVCREFELLWIMHTQYSW